MSAAVAGVEGLELRLKTLIFALFETKKITFISCPIASMVDSKARVPLVCSSSTAFTVLRSDVTFVTMTYDKTE